MLSRQILRASVLAACAALLFSLAAPASASEAGMRRALDAALDDAVRDRRIVGAVVLVLKDGMPVYQRPVGMADREAGLAMWNGALFRLSSVSKVFTAMAAAALVEQGRLDYDDPVTKYLPYFTPALANGEKPVITVRHLVTFTAGLDYGFAQPPDGPYAQAGVSDGLDDSGLTLEENLRRLASVPLLFPSGEKFNYSLAMDVMGAVIAAAHGKPFDQAMRDLVLAPLGLEDTFFSVPSAAAYRVAAPYYNADPEPRRMAEEGEVVYFGPAGIKFSPARAFDPEAFPSGGAGLISSAADVMTLLETIRDGGMPLTDPSLMREMCRNQIGDLRMMPGMAFGLGVGVVVDSAETGVPEPDGTVTWSGVYGNYWLTDPLNQISLVILTNTAFEGMAGKVVDDVKKAIYDNL